MKNLFERLVAAGLAALVLVGAVSTGIHAKKAYFELRVKEELLDKCEQAAAQGQVPYEQCLMIVVGK